MWESNIAWLAKAGFRERARVLLGAALLGLEIVQFVRARFSDTRYFCWAPFHSEARYKVDATVGGLALGDEAVARRYGLPRYYFDPKTRTDWELNAIAHVTDTIRATEAALPVGARARVVVTYRENGGQERRWSFP